jgi:hypothetical protein
MRRPLPLEILALEILALELLQLSRAARGRNRSPLRLPSGNCAEHLIRRIAQAAPPTPPFSASARVHRRMRREERREEGWGSSRRGVEFRF